MLIEFFLRTIVHSPDGKLVLLFAGVFDPAVILVSAGKRLEVATHVH